MADKKISQLPAATTPLAGSEVLPIVQSGTTVKVSVDNLTSGKSVSASNFVPTDATVPANGMFLSAANTVGIATNSAQRLTVNATGLGIGGTPSYQLDVQSTTASNIRLLAASSNSAYIRLSTTAHNWAIYADGSGGSMNMYSVTSGAQRFTLDTSGNITIAGATATKASGTTWANPSDIRLKDNVQDFTKGLAELAQINPCIWEYNGKGGTTAGTKGIGVIADEIEKVLPETVDTYKAKLNPDDEEEIDIKRFDATEITWLLVNSVKELKAEIETLKAQLATK